MRDAGKFSVLAGAIKSRGNIISVFTRVEMPLKKKQRKTKFLKRDSLCIIAKLEKGSYSDRRLPDYVYEENTSRNSSTTVLFMKKVSGRSR